MPAFLLELFLYSGQYGTFYLLANVFNVGFSQSTAEISHVVLVVSLVVQCALLAKYGSKPSARFFLSLLVPSAYFGAEWLESPSGLWNMGHVFFWIFSIVTWAAHAFALRKKTRSARLFAESAISLANVAVFVFTYFYFDLVREYGVDWVVWTALRDKLSIAEFPAGFAEFLEDPVHAYFLVGSLVLAVSMAFARGRILDLQDRVTELLGTYVGGSVKDKLLDSRHPRSQKKVATILFSDIRSFTSMSEKSSPEEIVKFLNDYFTLWDEAVTANGGWIDKFIGDAVMAVFDKGTEEENAASAISSANSVFTLLPRIKNGIFENGNIGVGIHSGELVMGDVGSASRRNFTVIGDTVNAASRLEGLCKEYGVTLIVSETVQNLAGSSYGLGCLGEAEIRGKAEKMKIFGR